MLLKQKGAYSPHSLSNSLLNGFDISQREMHSKGMNVPLRINVKREFNQRNLTESVTTEPGFTIMV